MLANMRRAGLPTLEHDFAGEDMIAVISRENRRYTTEDSNGYGEVQRSLDIKRSNIIVAL